MVQEGGEILGTNRTVDDLETGQFFDPMGGNPGTRQLGKDHLPMGHNLG